MSEKKKKALWVEEDTHTEVAVMAARGKVSIGKFLKDLVKKEKKSTPRKIADDIQKWLSDQKYQGEDILHSAVCCDHVGRMRFIKAIEQIIKAN